MRKLVLLVAGMLLMGGTMVLFAQCPDAVGVWTTNNGSLLSGRVSEAWCGDDGTAGPGEPGNTENAMSWEDPVLGAQWKAWGMYIDGSGALLIATYNHPNGNVTNTWRTNYLGGEYWLSGTHTWGAGVDLAGVLTSYVVTTDVTYDAGGNFLGAVSNVNFTGRFTDCPEANACVINFAIANAMLVWRTGFPVPMPAGYPPFLCGATEGELFDACCITISIDCLVETEEATWGSIKGFYR
jgi:hypothetical protein